MKQKLIEYLERLLRVSKDYFPDDDSKRDGYREAVEDILDYVKGLEENARVMHIGNPEPTPGRMK